MAPEGCRNVEYAGFSSASLDFYEVWEYGAANLRSTAHDYVKKGLRSGASSPDWARRSKMSKLGAGTDTSVYDQANVIFPLCALRARVGIWFEIF